MNNEQRVLLDLIRQSQFGVACSSDYPDIDWKAIYEEASIQSVLGIIAPEIGCEELKDRCKNAQLHQTASFIKYCYAQDKVKETLDKAGIPFVILKGSAAAIWYKDPSKRMMGDIDIIVKQDDFEKARETLIKSDYTVISNIKRHIGFKKFGVEVELHREFSHGGTDIDPYIFRDIDNCIEGEIDQSQFPMLPKLSNGLVLLLHMSQHLKSGMGLRQLIDWMMFVYKNIDDEYWNKEFEKVVKEHDLELLAITATRLCQLYLGLPETITWCKEADEKLCLDLLEILLISGNFGRKNDSGNSVEKTGTNIKRNGLFRWLQHAGEFNWKSYHKHHWLKPICWLYQLFRYFKQWIKTGRNGNQLRADLSRSRQRYDLLKNLHLIN